MPTIIDTSTRGEAGYSGNIGYWVYNGLDCAITHEVHTALLPMQDEYSEHVYQFERSLQALVLDMMGKGIMVDRKERSTKVARLREREALQQETLQAFAHAVWDQPLNPGSPAQLHKFFYGRMALPPVRVNVGKGIWKVSTNREALEKLSIHIYARPIISALLALKDTQKLIQTLTTGIDYDSVFRTSYNIAGTTTGRWSSSENCWGTGGNVQNMTEEVRRAFVARKGKKLAYLDLQQAESRAVGLLAWLATGKHKYLDACESGDLHTVVSKLCWPKLPWTGVLREDKKIAERKFYRHFSYRDLAKRGGHGTNYYGQAPTIAKNLQIPLPVAKSFQESYFYSFPEISEWHQHVENELNRNGYLTTPLSRRRYFFDRLDEASTLRAAIAFIPQSFIADLLNRILLNIWMDHPEIAILLQVHDAGVFEYDEDKEDVIIPILIKYMRTELTFTRADGTQRLFSIGSDAMVGWNWAKAYNRNTKTVDNPDGLMDYEPGSTRRRQNTEINPTGLQLLDIRMPKKKPIGNTLAQGNCIT
jgi:DNA polymerase I